MNNAINEITTTLEGTNSRKTKEAKDRISEVEDGMGEKSIREEKRKTN